jgi:uncharacterized protein YycO
MAFASSALAEAGNKYIPETGDIIFHTSLSKQSLAIQHATNSIYSHVGIVYVQGKQVSVFEAVGPVKITPLKSWINRGKNRDFVVKRLEKRLTDEQKQLLVKSGQSFIGKKYDDAFDWSDEKMYCSELVWKMYNNALGIKLSELKKLSDFNLNDPDVAPVLMERYQGIIPYNASVVPPSDLYDSTLLVVVAKQ